MLQKVYTTKEAAELCGESRQRIHNAMKRGHIRGRNHPSGFKGVALLDVKAYLKRPPKIGRPKKA